MKVKFTLYNYETEVTTEITQKQFEEMYIKDLSVNTQTRWTPSTLSMDIYYFITIDNIDYLVNLNLKY